MFVNLQNHLTFHSEERLVNLVRDRECFDGLSTYVISLYAYEALRVQAHQHHRLAPKLVGQAPKQHPAHHDPAEVGGGDEGGQEAPVAHQLPLGRDRPFVLLPKVEGVSILEVDRVER